MRPQMYLETRLLSVVQCMQVYANDLNPRSYHYLDINVKLNKVSSSHSCQPGIVHFVAVIRQLWMASSV